MEFKRLYTILSSGTKDELEEFCKNNKLIIKDGKIYHKSAAEVEKEIEYWDKRQHVKKIVLNSLYGALLNKGCRFSDRRIGQSVTLTGKQIVKHMNAKVNQIITGEYDYIGKAITYADTDSCYFTAYPTLRNDIEKGIVQWRTEDVISLYDNIGNVVNDSFPAFMYNTFHCPRERGAVIRAGREIVGRKALFITKKKYAVLVYDKEGNRTDVDGNIGDIKAMGLDLKRSDTPEYMQKFLKEILEMVLIGCGEDIILPMIGEFRTKFKAKSGWEKGTPKRVNNVTKYQEKENTLGRANMPGHVRASINWNTLSDIHGDKHSPKITDGGKVIVCKLKPNSLGIDSVAYPVDEIRLPEWYTELPFDHMAMEAVIIDKKISNLIGVLKWDLLNTYDRNSADDLFTFF